MLPYRVRPIALLVVAIVLVGPGCSGTHSHAGSEATASQSVIGQPTSLHTWPSYTLSTQGLELVLECSTKWRDESLYYLVKVRPLSDLTRGTLENAWARPTGQGIGFRIVLADADGFQLDTLAVRLRDFSRVTAPDSSALRLEYRGSKNMTATTYSTVSAVILTNTGSIRAPIRTYKLYR